MEPIHKHSTKIVPLCDSRMIPEPVSEVHKGQVLPKPSKMAAQEFHEAIRKVLINQDSWSESMTEEEMNKILLEFAYRGCDIRYKNPDE